MWTVCWVDMDGNDHWDRAENRRDVLEILMENEIDAYDEDVLIFSPDANDCLYSAWDIYNE